MFWNRELARLTGADCFVLALDRKMRRSGQHGLLGQTHVRIEGVPNLSSLENSAARLAEKFPLLDAVVRRNPFTFRPCWHEVTSGPRRLPVNLWHESGAAVPDGAHAREIASEHEWAEDVLNQPLDSRFGLRNLRVDLLLLRGGRSVLVLTWAHLLFDGKGAEYLLDALVNPAPDSGAPEQGARPPAQPTATLRSRIREAGPVVQRFFQLSGTRFESLGGPAARPGRLNFRTLSFDEAATREIQARMEAAVGPLFSIGYFFACALRAHREAFLARGKDPASYLVSIPVQIRKKGKGAVPFQNSVTILFFALAREALGTVESAARTAQEQFEEMTRAGMDRSFRAVLDLMRVLPAPVYMWFVARQFGGEITSFFHSFTGDFSADLSEVFGARVSNAYHVPAVSSPPGSGLFLGLFQGRLNITLSWRDGSVNESEAERILDRLHEDFAGVPLRDAHRQECQECAPT